MLSQLAALAALDSDLSKQALFSLPLNLTNLPGYLLFDFETSSLV